MKELGTGMYSGTGSLMRITRSACQTSITKPQAVQHY